MMKKILGIAAILLSTLFVLTACGADDANSEFVGRWLRQPMHESVRGTEIFIFNSGGEGVFHDGRLAYRGLDATDIIWNVNGDRFEIFFGGQLRAEIYYFEFEDDDTLILRRIGWMEGTEFVLTRVQE